MKRTSLDGLMTEIVRLIYDDKCCRCGETIRGANSQAAHFFSRRYNITRWHLDNILLLCAGCHRFVDSVDAEEKRAVWIRWLGMTRYEELRERFFQSPIRYKLHQQSEIAAHYRREVERLTKLRRNGVTGYLDATSFD